MKMQNAKIILIGIIMVGMVWISECIGGCGNLNQFTSEN